MDSNFQIRHSIRFLGIAALATIVCMAQFFAPSFSIAEPQASGQLYAVVAGVTRFKDPKFRPLTVSDKDAKDFYAFLQSQKHLFPGTHLFLFVNEQATRDNLTKALRDELKQATKDDYVIIYLSGHGAADPQRPDEYYFITNDSKFDNLYGTALWMNQKALFKGVDSDRVLLLSDACHSGGFSPGLEKSVAKEAGSFFSLFEGLNGRIAIASSRPDELSFENTRYGNSIFTHFLLKGLRGEAARNSGDGNITAKQLYDYVYSQVRGATKNGQSPQLYCAKGKTEDTAVFRSPVYRDPLKVRVQFMWKDDGERVWPLTNESVLKSGQRIGCHFKPESNCCVYVFWWDSTGTVGRLYPNPQLTRGSAEVGAAQDYWIPTKEDGKHWYVLDKNVGEETIYFVASRGRNPRIEALYEKLRNMSQGSRTSKQAEERSERLEEELERIMGVEPYTVADKSGISAEKPSGELFEAMENEIKISGAEAVYKVKFRHVAP